MLANHRSLVVQWFLNSPRKPVLNPSSNLRRYSSHPSPNQIRDNPVVSLFNQANSSPALSNNSHHRSKHSRSNSSLLPWWIRLAVRTL